MKELLVILIVFAVILVLTAIRYRRQIAAVLQIWRSLKKMRQQMGASSRPQVGDDESVSSGPLVNCARCGTWVPDNRAIKLPGGAIYCSTNCLESTGKAR